MWLNVRSLNQSVIVLVKRQTLVHRTDEKHWYNVCYLMARRNQSGYSTPSNSIVCWHHVKSGSCARGCMSARVLPPETQTGTGTLRARRSPQWCSIALRTVSVTSHRVIGDFSARLVVPVQPLEICKWCIRVCISL